MKYGLLSFGGMSTTIQLAIWRDDCVKVNDIRKAKRIQKVIDVREIRHGGHVAYRND